MERSYCSAMKLTFVIPRLSNSVAGNKNVNGDPTTPQVVDKVEETVDTCKALHKVDHSCDTACANYMVKYF